jgi:nitrogen fixation NifU-like protein
MTIDLHNLYGEVLLDHSRSTRNRRPLAHPFTCAEGDNPLCGDRVRFFVRVEDGVIADASYEGAGCAISLASASMACDAVRARPVHDAIALSERFIASLTGADPDADATSALPDDLAALSGVRQFPMRVKCATLAWRAMRQSIASAQETTP